MHNSKIKNLTEYRLKATGQVGLPAFQVSSLPGAPKLKLLDQVRQAIRTRHYSYMTEKAYVGWIKRFIFFHTSAILSEA